MKGIVYSKNHRHLMTFCREHRHWEFFACEMDGPYRCTVVNRPLPAGTKFDQENARYVVVCYPDYIPGNCQSN